MPARRQSQSRHRPSQSLGCKKPLGFFPVVGPVGASKAQIPEGPMDPDELTLEKYRSAFERRIKVEFPTLVLRSPLVLYGILRFVEQNRASHFLQLLDITISEVLGSFVREHKERGQELAELQGRARIHSASVVAFLVRQMCEYEGEYSNREKQPRDAHVFNDAECYAAAVDDH